MPGEETFALQGTDRCPNCGAEVRGHYCHHCGHKHRTPQDYSIRKFLAHFFLEITQLDSKLLRSFVTLLFHPGKLTAEWRAGRERSYVKPVQLFLIVNIFYFIVLHFSPIDTIVVSLQSQYSWQQYSPAIRPIIDRELKSSNLTFQKFEERYDPISAEQSKTLLFLMVPIFACVVNVLFWQRHRYFVEHVVFSLHFYSFFLLVISVGLLLMNLLIDLWVRVWNMQNYMIDWDAWTMWVPGALSFVYLAVALQRVYGGRARLNRLRAGILAFSLLYILWIYRFVLFFTTMAVLKL